MAVGPKIVPTPRYGYCPCCIQSWRPGVLAISVLDDNLRKIVVCENCIKLAYELIQKAPVTSHERMLQDAARRDRK